MTRPHDLAPARGLFTDRSILDLSLDFRWRITPASVRTNLRIRVDAKWNALEREGINLYVIEISSILNCIAEKKKRLYRQE